MGTILNIVAAVHEISNWLIRIIMLLVITRRHRPQSALVWLLVVFITPWLGLLLYALLGTNRLPRKRVVQAAKRRFRRMGRDFAKGAIEADKIRSVVASFLGYMKHCNGRRSANSAIARLKQ